MSLRTSAEVKPRKTQLSAVKSTGDYIDLLQAQALLDSSASCAFRARKACAASNDAAVSALEAKE
jgi:hypothetical protein